MLSLVLRGIRTRWVTFAGSFVALALGVGIVATTGLALAATFDAPHRGPERFAAAPVLVRGEDRLRVDTPIGVRTRPLTDPRPVPAALAAQLAGLGRTELDRTFPVTVGHTGGGVVGHPWPIAAATPYRLASGRAPAASGEIVVTAGNGSGPEAGDRVTVTTPAGSATRTVVGTVTRPPAPETTAPGTAAAAGATSAPGTAAAPEATGFETAVFFTEAEAARISPDIDAVVVHADPAAVRAAVGRDSGMAVLTGDERRRADPDPDRDAEALVSVNALLGTAAGITAFVSVFVIASTFSYGVAQRRREFGLLRTAGATPGQVRRLVYADAVLVGVLASAAGCRLGLYGAPRLASWMAGEGIAPRWFAIGDQSWPLHTAFWTGLAVALAGAVAAAHRAGRTGPVEALRESAVDSGSMPLSRVLVGAAVLLTGAVLVAVALVQDPGGMLKRKTYLTQPMLLIAGCALFAPVLVRPATRLLTWLPARLPGATGVLTRENASAGLRRTAAVAAPVIVTVALAASLMGTTATIDAAKAAEARTQATGDFVATADGGGGALSPRFVERARHIPGAVVSASRSTSVTVLEEGTALVGSEARAVDPADAAAVSALPVVAGRFADLDDGGIVVNEEWLTRTVGERVGVWLGDGRHVTLRVVAVLATGTGGNGVYLTPRNAAGAGIDRVDVGVRAGADGPAVAERLYAAGRATGTDVLTTQRWVAAAHPATGGSTRTGLLMILAIALLYTGIALANTQVMATSDRVRELAVLRLAGATKAQVLRLVGVEALAVVGVGAVLGAVVAALNLLGVHAALGLLGVGSGVVVPWGTVGPVVAVSAALAVVFAVLPASLALRTRPVELAGARE
ncbi:putative ABC transport system permease protein [Streptomyces sp. 840.1]|uniref:FtsX family ABC transporter permease n=1 Tax=Streptomyces sp. 840.1 TaxID=2485152 RepID=UPI000F4A9CA6|nr:FtsX family ABC transporter permease [Streptomyces sp. 840.1]ROQ68006.1 putative ABC transport system permease protein [Streptomyces sp. 840.1]